MTVRNQKKKVALSLFSISCAYLIFQLSLFILVCFFHMHFRACFVEFLCIPLKILNEFFLFFFKDLFID